MSVPPSVNPDCFWGEVPVDEWTYAKKLRAWGAADGVGDAYLKQRLNRHWDTWVTRDEIATLAEVALKQNKQMKKKNMIQFACSLSHVMGVNT